MFENSFLKVENIFTYAGGIASSQDIEYIQKTGKGRLFFTIGSALDIFGGDISYRWVVKNFKKV